MCVDPDRAPLIEVVLRFGGTALQRGQLDGRSRRASRRWLRLEAPFDGLTVEASADGGFVLDGEGLGEAARNYRPGEALRLALTSRVALEVRPLGGRPDRVASGLLSRSPGGALTGFGLAIGAHARWRPGAGDLPLPLPPGRRLSW